MSHPQSGAHPRTHTHSFRLTFSYAGTVVRLSNVEHVNAISPGAVGDPPAPDSTGFWIQVRDAEGQVVYHLALHDPVRSTIEVFGEGPDEAIHRVPNPAAEGEFDVLVPDLGDEVVFALHGPKPRTRKSHGPSAELLTAGMGELRQWRADRRDGDSPNQDDRDEPGDENGDELS